ncbi:hypothetical protein CSUI_002337, partial [Cystoisospora suis]
MGDIGIEEEEEGSCAPLLFHRRTPRLAHRSLGAWQGKKEKDDRGAAPYRHSETTAKSLLLPTTEKDDGEPRKEEDRTSLTLCFWMDERDAKDKSSLSSTERSDAVESKKSKRKKKEKERKKKKKDFYRGSSDSYEERSLDSDVFVEEKRREKKKKEERRRRDVYTEDEEDFEESWLIEDEEEEEEKRRRRRRRRNRERRRDEEEEREEKVRQDERRRRRERRGEEEEELYRLWREQNRYREERSFVSRSVEEEEEEGGESAHRMQTSSGRRTKREEKKKKKEKREEVGRYDRRLTMRCLHEEKSRIENYREKKGEGKKDEEGEEEEEEDERGCFLHIGREVQRCVGRSKRYEKKKKKGRREQEEDEEEESFFYDSFVSSSSPSSEDTCQRFTETTLFREKELTREERKDKKRDLYSSSERCRIRRDEPAKGEEGRLFRQKPQNIERSEEEEEDTCTWKREEEKEEESRASFLLSSQDDPSQASQLVSSALLLSRLLIEYHREVETLQTHRLFFFLGLASLLLLSPSSSPPCLISKRRVGKEERRDKRDLVCAPENSSSSFTDCDVPQVWIWSHLAGALGLSSEEERLLFPLFFTSSSFSSHRKKKMEKESTNEDGQERTRGEEEGEEERKVPFADVGASCRFEREGWNRKRKEEVTIEDWTGRKEEDREERISATHFSTIERGEECTSSSSFSSSSCFLSRHREDEEKKFRVLFCLYLERMIRKKETSKIEEEEDERTNLRRDVEKWTVVSILHDLLLKIPRHFLRDVYSSSFEAFLFKTLFFFLLSGEDTSLDFSSLENESPRSKETREEKENKKEEKEARCQPRIEINERERKKKEKEASRDKEEDTIGRRPLSGREREDRRGERLRNTMKEVVSRRKDEREVEEIDEEERERKEEEIKRHAYGSSKEKRNGEKETYPFSLPNLLQSSPGLRQRIQRYIFNDMYAKISYQSLYKQSKIEKSILTCLDVSVPSSASFSLPSSLSPSSSSSSLQDVLTVYRHYLCPRGVQTPEPPLRSMLSLFDEGLGKEDITRFLNERQISSILSHELTSSFCPSYALGNSDSCFFITAITRCLANYGRNRRKLSELVEMSGMIKLADASLYRDLNLYEWSVQIAKERYERDILQWTREKKKEEEKEKEVSLTRRGGLERDERKDGEERRYLMKKKESERSSSENQPNISTDRAIIQNAPLSPSPHEDFKQSTQQSMDDQLLDLPLASQFPLLIPRPCLLSLHRSQRSKEEEEEEYQDDKETHTQRKSPLSRRKRLEKNSTDSQPSSFSSSFSSSSSRDACQHSVTTLAYVLDPSKRPFCSFLPPREDEESSQKRGEEEEKQRAPVKVEREDTSFSHTHLDIPSAPPLSPSDLSPMPHSSSHSLYSHSFHTSSSSSPLLSFSSPLFSSSSSSSSPSSSSFSTSESLYTDRFLQRAPKRRRVLFSSSFHRLRDSPPPSWLLSSFKELCIFLPSRGPKNSSHLLLPRSSSPSLSPSPRQPAKSPRGKRLGCTEEEEEGQKEKKKKKEKREDTILSRLKRTSEEIDVEEKYQRVAVGEIHTEMLQSFIEVWPDLCEEGSSSFEDKLLAREWIFIKTHLPLGKDDGEEDQRRRKRREEEEEEEEETLRRGEVEEEGQAVGGVVRGMKGMSSDRFSSSFLSRSLSNPTSLVETKRRDRREMNDRAGEKREMTNEEDEGVSDRDTSSLGSELEGEEIKREREKEIDKKDTTGIRCLSSSFSSPLSPSFPNFSTSTVEKEKERRDESRHQTFSEKSTFTYEATQIKDEEEERRRRREEEERRRRRREGEEEEGRGTKEMSFQCLSHSSIPPGDFSSSSLLHSSLLPSASSSFFCAVSCLLGLSSGICPHEVSLLHASIRPRRACETEKKRLCKILKSLITRCFIGEKKRQKNEEKEEEGDRHQDIAIRAKTDGRGRNEQWREEGEKENKMKRAKASVEFIRGVIYEEEEEKEKEEEEGEREEERMVVLPYGSRVNGSALRQSDVDMSVFLSYDQIAQLLLSKKERDDAYGASSSSCKVSSSSKFKMTKEEEEENLISAMGLHNSSRPPPRQRGDGVSSSRFREEVSIEDWTRDLEKNERRKEKEEDDDPFSSCAGTARLVEGRKGRWGGRCLYTLEDSLPLLDQETRQQKKNEEKKEEGKSKEKKSMALSVYEEDSLGDLGDVRSLSGREVAEEAAYRLYREFTSFCRELEEKAFKRRIRRQRGDLSLSSSSFPYSGLHHERTDISGERREEEEEEKEREEDEEEDEEEIGFFEGLHVVCPTFAPPLLRGVYVPPGYTERREADGREREKAEFARLERLRERRKLQRKRRKERKKQDKLSSGSSTALPSSSSPSLPSSSSPSLPSSSSPCLPSSSSPCLPSSSSPCLPSSSSPSLPSSSSPSLPSSSSPSLPSSSPSLLSSSFCPLERSSPVRVSFSKSLSATSSSSLFPIRFCNREISEGTAGSERRLEKEEDSREEEAEKKISKKEEKQGVDRKREEQRKKEEENGRESMEGRKEKREEKKLSDLSSHHLHLSQRGRREQKEEERERDEEEEEKEEDGLHVDAALSSSFVSSKSYAAKDSDEEEENGEARREKKVDKEIKEDEEKKKEEEVEEYQRLYQVDHEEEEEGQDEDEAVEEIPKIPFEVSFNNLLGVLNSRLLKCYFHQDRRVSILGRIVKYWAEKRNLSGVAKGGLSSYAWALLVIFFGLNTVPPLLKNLQMPQSSLLQGEKHDSETTSGGEEERGGEEEEEGIGHEGLSLKRGSKVGDERRRTSEKMFQVKMKKLMKQVDKPGDEEEEEGVDGEIEGNKEEEAERKADELNGCCLGSVERRRMKMKKKKKKIWTACSCFSSSSSSPSTVSIFPVEIVGGCNNVWYLDPQSRLKNPLGSRLLDLFAPFLSPSSSPSLSSLSSAFEQLKRRLPVLRNACFFTPLNFQENEEEEAQTDLLSYSSTSTIEKRIHRHPDPLSCSFLSSSPSSPCRSSPLSHPPILAPTSPLSSYAPSHTTRFSPPLSSFSSHSHSSFLSSSSSPSCHLNKTALPEENLSFSHEEKREERHPCLHVSSKEEENEEEEESYNEELTSLSYMEWIDVCDLLHDFFAFYSYFFDSFTSLVSLRMKRGENYRKIDYERWRESCRQAFSCHDNFVNERREKEVEAPGEEKEMTEREREEEKKKKNTKKEKRQEEPSTKGDEKENLYPLFDKGDADGLSFSVRMTKKESSPSSFSSRISSIAETSSSSFSSFNSSVETQMKPVLYHHYALVGHPIPSGYQPGVCTPHTNSLSSEFFSSTSNSHVSPSSYDLSSSFLSSSCPRVSHSSSPPTSLRCKTSGLPVLPAERSQAHDPSEENESAVASAFSKRQEEDSRETENKKMEKREDENDDKEEEEEGRKEIGTHQTKMREYDDVRTGKKENKQEEEEEEGGEERKNVWKGRRVSRPLSDFDHQSKAIKLFFSVMNER